MLINAVAPFAGAWIEIKGADVLSLPLFVAPFAGAWIEIRDMLQCDNIYECVAPFAGAWIEIGLYVAGLVFGASLPSRERGLKSDNPEDVAYLSGRSLRGSVD